MAGTPAPAAPHAVETGTWVWPTTDDWFGGFSGLDTDAKGEAFMAVSDLGYLVRGRFLRDGAGRVTGVDFRYEDIVTFRGPDEADAEDQTDAEGLTFLPGGGFAVSFERTNRFERFDRPAPRGTDFTANADVSGVTWNKGFEAIAAAADGAIYAIPEQPVSHRGPFPVQVFRDGAWSTPFSLPGHGWFRPVGADFGPDGRLYVLERDFWGLVGFMSRVRRLTLAGDAIVADEVLLETKAGMHQNLEGIAVWADEGGGIRLTMISDDNMSRFQWTEVVDYAVIE
ncbi:MAG: esterase-like activity of phytase family protein [Rhodobacteraceae bacterium]|nr:esterase-like activity of phytase family protein [Paracoccaceae bacterium]